MVPHNLPVRCRLLLYYSLADDKPTLIVMLKLIFVA
jgi:hypothetical protein